jgi:hypothetical protein
MLSQQVHPEKIILTQKSPLKWINICIAIYFIFSLISDLVLSLLKNNCKTSFLQLQIWFFVHSIIPLGFVGIIFVYKMCFECFSINHDKIIVLIFNLCMAFSFVWLIVGSILFWGFLMQSDECLLWVNYYTTIRLIIGYLFYIILIFLYYFK